MGKFRVLVADDHTRVREGLCALITSQPIFEVVGAVADGAEAVEQARLVRPDVVVMDISMPKLGGAAATRQVLADEAGTKVLALSAHEEAVYVREMLDAGATGYLLKRSAPEALIEALHRVLAGEIYLDPALPPRPAAPPAPQPQAVGGEVALSAVETSVLQGTACGQTRREIASQLGIHESDVGAAQERGMQKLGLDSRIGLVRYAAAHGWLNVPPQP